MSLNDEEIAAIEERASAATDGPWFTEAHGIMDASRSYTICMTGDSAEDCTDAAFIAHAREDVPALVADLRACRTERDAAREALAQTREWGESWQAMYEGTLLARDRFEAERDALRAALSGLLERARKSGFSETSGPPAFNEAIRVARRLLEREQ